MVIYGNNLHEKLQGIAISKDYIKYATPLCDLVDDPELAPDIDLAVNFNQAINGDPIAATRFTDTLILSGYLFDTSTKEYYRNKMTSNPKVWGNLIRDIKYGFENNAFKDALKDCLNSPCNLFAETSDSVARLAQVASTKNGSNSFGVGDLSATFINITNGLDDAVTKKLPAIFSGAALELTQNVKSARSNIEAVVAGKKNLNELTSLANASGTMRGTNKIYRYTPDLKSYTDYTNLGNNILLRVKQKLGGCFERFEGAYRYNPYEDNTSVPATVQKQQYNGVSYETSPNGVVNQQKFKNKSLNLSGEDGSPKNTIPFATGGKLLKEDLPPNLQPLYDDYIKYGEEYGVDPRFLASISILETGGGTSKAFREGNNAMGISNTGAKSSVNYYRNDPAAAGRTIRQMARSLAGAPGTARNYGNATTISQIGPIYAPAGAINDIGGTNSEWGNEVSNIMRRDFGVEDPDDLIVINRR